MNHHTRACFLGSGALPLLLGFALLCSACGGDSQAPTPPAPTTPVPAPNQAPTPVGTIENVRLATDASAATVDVSDHFSDPDGDTLTYEAASATESVATVSISGSEVSVAPVSKGDATITVTAKDPDGLSASQEFKVSVLEVGRVVFFAEEDDDLEPLGLEELVAALPPELAEVGTGLMELEGLLVAVDTELSFLSGAFACRDSDTYSKSVRDTLDALSALVEDESLGEVLFLLVELAFILEAEEPDFSSFDADALTEALDEINSKLEGVVSVVRAMNGRVHDEECAIFYDDARVLWDGEERTISVTLGDETIEGVLIPVWGSPDAGMPLRTLAESKWWIAKDETSFASESESDAAPSFGWTARKGRVLPPLLPLSRSLPALACGASELCGKVTPGR